MGNFDIFPAHRHDCQCPIRTPLCPSFNNLMVSIAADWLPEGYDVIVGAPNSLQDLKNYYHNNKKIAVELSGSGGCTMGDSDDYYAFRAWHDLVHVLYDCEFTWEGERKAALVHQGEVVKRLGYNHEAFFFGALIEVEIVAQNVFVIQTGDYPAQPRCFAEKWLRDRKIDCPPQLVTNLITIQV